MLNTKKDVILDTDTYNEIDDQFALAYLMKSDEELNTVAVYAAPFFNPRSESPKDGMEKSYDEIHKVLKLLKREDFKSVFKGSEDYLKDEKAPQMSDAALDLAERAMSYSPDNPLYVVGIGAITNIASALLIKPEIKDNIIVVWLGGNEKDGSEFNMYQDIAAARVVMKSGVRFVQLPAFWVVSEFSFTKKEIEECFVGKNELADYLGRNTIEYMDKRYNDVMQTKVIWDVCAVAYMLNGEEKFVETKETETILPGYDKRYDLGWTGDKMCIAYKINKDAILKDLIKKIC